MFPQVHRGQSLLGSLLTLAASALVVVSAAGEAEARKGFGSSNFKSHSKSSPYSSDHDNVNSSKRGEDMHDEGKHADGKREEPEAEGADTGGGMSLKPSISFSQDDDEAKKNEPAKDAAQGPQSPADGAKSATAEKSPAAPASRKKAVVERAPHPLAAGHAGMDVTVCEAGCVNRAEEPHVVYQQMTTRKAVENVGEMTPAASGGPAAAADPGKDVIVCLGGCYDTPRVYSTPQAKTAAKQFEWKASVTPTSADGKAAGSGEWMRRIDASQDAKPGS